MPLSIILKLAIRSLFGNKLRSFLSILGIVIGISSVIILMAAGVGAQNYILDTVQSFGSNKVQIMPGAPAEEGGFSPSFAGITITTLTYDDAIALRNNLQAPNIANTTATVGGQIIATSDYNEKVVQFTGTSPSYFEIQNTKVESGRPFDERETDSMARVAILGPDVADKLFPNINPIDKSIKINNINFKIIGITESKGVGQFGINLDDIIYIPITTGQKLILGINYINNLIIAADTDNSTPLAAEQAKLILRDRHRITEGEKNDFTIMDSKDALETINNVTNALSWFLTAIAAISLLVGGIGIMNIMLVTVTERTKEIGLRKSIGATRTDILSQFIIESIIITLFGGIIGIAIGFLVSFGINNFTSLRTEVTTFSVILAFSVSTASGIIFGYYPANKAAKMNPIDALRFQ
jgi:putative ABC transport system permease protein